MPRALYKVCREAKLANPNPVVLTHGRASSSSRQIRDYAMCGDCEARFNRNGETKILPLCYRGPDRFGLRSLLRCGSPLKTTPIANDIILMPVMIAYQSTGAVTGM